MPLDTAYKPAQVRTILDSSGARLLLTSLRYHDTARTAARLGAAGSCTLALLEGTADGFATPDLAAGSGAPGTDDPPLVDVAGSDAAVILYTSGTTADPKGVVLTHANLDAERLAAFGVIAANERDAVLGVLPLFHALAQMANLLLPLSVGARVVFLETRELRRRSCRRCRRAASRSSRACRSSSTHPPARDGRGRIGGRRSRVRC